MKRNWGRKGKAAAFGDAGAVYVEFLVVVMPFLLLCFGLTQLGLIYGAQLLVEHAAARAVRAAIVILPDDHEDADYSGVPVNTVGAAGAGDGLWALATAPSGGRLDKIRKAARMTLAPVSPSIDSLGADSLAAAIGSSALASSLVGYAAWGEMAVAVSFPNGEGGYRTSFGGTGPVTVRVTFMFRCAVPVAKEIMCGAIGSLPSERGQELSTTGVPLLVAGELAGWRVVALQAERTMPNQGR